MTIIAGVERGFVPRTEAVTRLTTWIFLLEQTVFMVRGHIGLMQTTESDPFSTKDNGGDLVETSFLCQGLLAVREYFKNGNTAEKALANKADQLWRGVEWSWYTKGRDTRHWSLIIIGK
jgi:hypothetical protein